MTGPPDATDSGVVFPDFIQTPEDVYRGLAEAKRIAAANAANARSRLADRLEREKSLADGVLKAKLHKLAAGDEYAMVRYGRIVLACEWLMARMNDPDRTPTLFENGADDGQAEQAAEQEEESRESQGGGQVEQHYDGDADELATDDPEVDD